MAIKIVGPATRSSISVSGPDPHPGLMTDPPNPMIDGIFPFSETDPKAVATFNTPQGGAIKLPDNPAIDGIIPAPNRPIPDTSTVAPARVMVPLPVIFMNPPTPPAQGNPNPPPIVMQ